METFLKNIRYLHLWNTRPHLEKEDTVKIVMYDDMGHELTTIIVTEVEGGYSVYRYYKLGEPGLFEGLRTQREVLDKIKQIHGIVYGSR